MTKQELMAEAKRISELGCSDGYCKFTGPAKGMHTNGGCRCCANPISTDRGPYGDLQYLATLLGLIYQEWEENEQLLANSTRI